MGSADMIIYTYTWINGSFGRFTTRKQNLKFCGRFARSLQQDLEFPVWLVAYTHEIPLCHYGPPK